MGTAGAHALNATEAAMAAKSSFVFKRKCAALPHDREKSRNHMAFIVVRKRFQHILNNLLTA
jgi:hypothetical protein